ncbi:MAG: metal ABC transporter ATP-binding protein [Candidatus Hadarchaeota archaeon]
MSEEILEVSDLTVVLGGRTVLHNLNFTVEGGDVLVILGPNGAGKTTLLRALLDLVPYEGEVMWGTDDISYLPSQEFFERRDIPPLSVEEFFELKDVSHKEVRNILQKVGLVDSVLDQDYGTLSTGQFHRMTIAWALVDDPSVLLFDEPTAGIDVGGQETIYTLLHDFWRERELTVLLVTHDLSVVWEHASQVLCLNKKKLCSGRPEKVLSPEQLEELYGTGVSVYKHEHRR